MAACGGKHLRLLFGSAPLTHDMWEQIFFFNYYLGCRDQRGSGGRGKLSG